MVELNKTERFRSRDIPEWASAQRRFLRVALRNDDVEAARVILDNITERVGPQIAQGVFVGVMERDGFSLDDGVDLEVPPVR